MHRSLLLFVLLALMAVPAGAQQFGGAIAIGDDAVFVGETRNRTTASEVYVYRRDADGAWQEAARLAASDAPKDANGFGHSLSLDGEMLLIGANDAAYVFHRSGDAWQQHAKLTADGLDDDARFGRIVALSGDHALVTAPGANTVVVFHHDGGVWTEQTRLTGSDVTEDASFGSTLAFDGDFALVGAPGQNEQDGAVYVFSRADGWQQTAHLAPEMLSDGARLGSSLALRDGYALVGASRAEDNAGRVLAYRYDAEEMAWQHETTLAPFTAESGRRGTRFGAAVALTDGEAWVGAPGEARGSGAAYVFHKDPETGAWTSAKKQMAADLAGRASLGGALAVHGSVAVAGATGVDFGEGAAVIFEQDGRAWAERAVVIDEAAGFDSITGEAVPCVEDAAAGFQCDKIDLISFLSVRDLGGGRGTRLNDIWGWTDPETGKEYALVGRSDAAVFVDVTDPYNPLYLGELPMTEGANPSVWRDIKVYKDHAFIVSDGAGKHGMQVFDLRRLRDVPNPPVTFEPDVHYDQIASAHNIVINEETGYAYSVGSSGGGETCGGGLHIIDIRQPDRPTFAGCFADPTTGRRKTGYSHDAQCVTYAGPDAEHQGKEICFGSNETALSIADVTDKQNPKPLSMATYPKVAYSHQGWLTEDHRYFYMNDEGDEPQGLVEGTRTLIWDVSDLDDPILVKEHIATTTATDHNLYVKGNLMYQSNYDAGFRVLDITDPENPVEVGYFDTVPSEGAGGGSWSNYPYFKSGVIIVTSIREGLFLLKEKGVDL